MPPPLPILMTFPLPPSAHRPDVEVAATAARGGVRAGPARRHPGPARPSRRRAAGARGAGGPRGRGTRVPASDVTRGRLADAVATAFNEGEGVAVALDNGDRRRFSAHPTCSNCGAAAPALTPILFSFNNRGARAPGAMASAPSWSTTNRSSCPTPGRAWRRVRSIRGPNRGTKPPSQSCARTARAKGIPLDAPWTDLSGKARHSCSTAPAGDSSALLPFLQRLE